MNDDELVEHIMLNQVDPQLRAARAREQGHNIDIAHVNVAPDATVGYLVTCIRCGRQARSPVDPGPRVAVCPPCIRAVDL